MNYSTGKPAFFQIRDAIYASGLKPSLRFTLIALSDHLNSIRGDWKVWLSQKSIAEKTGYGERSIRRYTHTLGELGFVTIESKKCPKGERYVYTVNHKKLGLPAKLAGGGAANQTEAPAKLADKEQNTKSKVREKIEALSERSAPSATAGGIDWKTEKQTRREKAKQLCRNYVEACKSSAKAREAFWHKLGRLYFPDSPQFFPDHNLTHLQRKTMTRIFEDMPTTGCKVLAHVFQNWPSDGKYKAPNLSGLDEYSSTDLYQSWKQATDYETMNAPLYLVAANLNSADFDQVAL